MNGSKKKWVEVLTPEFRVSFPNVFKAKSQFAGQPEKYNCVMLFDKKADLKKMQAAITEVLVDNFGADKTKWPKGLRMPFRDGDEKEFAGYAGCVFVNASSMQKPGLVDQRRNDIISEEEFYAGCYARAQLSVFYYDKAGNKGVSFGLMNVQKIRDGERFSGRKDAADVFEDVESGSDEAANYEKPEKDFFMS